MKVFQMKPIPVFIPLRKALKRTLDFYQMKMSRSLWYSGSNRNLGRESSCRYASATVAMGIILNDTFFYVQSRL
jgi:hypothetical protein